MRTIIALLLLGTLAGCSANRLPIPAGFTPIASTTGLQLGHLYFSGQGQRPAFQTNSGTVFNELCYFDFDIDPELKTVGSHIEDKGIDVAKFTATPKLSVDGSVPIPLLSDLAPGMEGALGRSYVVENLRRFELSAAGTQLVMDNIGHNCRQEIARLQRDGRDVILLTAAQRADTVTDSINYSLGGTVTLPLLGETGGTGEDKYVTEYKMVYLSALLATEL